MRRDKDTFFNGHNQLSGRMFLLMAISATSLTLAACSPANTSASNATSMQAEPSAVQTLQVQDDKPAPENAPIINQSALLKNVSATVYKDANCGCCKEWVNHAQGHGLSAKAQDVADVSLFKDRYGVPQQMRSCHTTVTTDGYVFEGHVPAKHMAQFLASPPSDAIGLAVPSMPVGSPGMEYQDRFMPYKVMQINKDGTTEVYADIESPKQQM